MRTIKFRGLDVKTNIFIYGDLITFEKGFGISETEYDRNFCFVKTDSIGQFTELYDIEGNEIYEGDILKDKDGNYLYIIYSDGCFDIRIRIKDKFFSTDTFLKKAVIDSFGLKVIGNIHDNPELFKQ